LHRLPAFLNRMGTLIDRAVEHRLCLLRSRSQQTGHGLKAQEQAIEALQQRIVQLAGNSGPFAEATDHPLPDRRVSLVNGNRGLIRRHAQQQRVDRGRKIEPLRSGHEYAGVGNVSSETEQHLKQEFRTLGRDASNVMLTAAVHAEIYRLKRQAATLRRLRGALLTVA
jgi:hypothetical protein